MALKDSMDRMNQLLCEIMKDLEKVAGGNRAAAQRARTHSIRFEKVAKLFRKESIAAEKTGVLKKTKAAGKKAPKRAGKAKSAKAKTAKKKVHKRAAPKKRAKSRRKK